MDSVVCGGIVGCNAVRSSCLVLSLGMVGCILFPTRMAIGLDPPTKKDANQKRLASDRVLSDEE